MQLLNTRELGGFVQCREDHDPGLRDAQPSRFELRDRQCERGRVALGSRSASQRIVGLG